VNFVRSLPVFAEPEVLVVGAGCAGTAAALAAARQGVDTLLIERSGFCGGYITNVCGPALDGFVDLRSGRPVAGGIAMELATAAAITDAPEPLANFRFHFNVELGHLRDEHDRYRIRFEVERFKLVADRLLTEAGVRTVYHTVVADAIASGGRVNGVVVANKAGLGVIRAGVIVDASGDADVVAFAGGGFEFDPADCQPMSLHFRVGGLAPTRQLRAACGEVLDAAHREGLLGLYAGPWMSEIAPHEVYFNATRINGNPLDPEDLSRAEMQGREDAHAMFALFKERIPEFRDAHFASSGPVVGVRESRRIRGEETLTAADIVERRSHADVVGLGAWWLDRHPSASSGYHEHVLVRPYDIPFGSLVPRGLANVVVAGRCHSAESGALASSRVTVTCMVMGQAAGIAAALATRRQADMREVPIAALQDGLLANGAVILDRADRLREEGDRMSDGETVATPNLDLIKN
jgi:hypothetical protein